MKQDLQLLAALQIALVAAGGNANNENLAKELMSIALDCGQGLLDSVGDCVAYAAASILINATRNARGQTPEVVALLDAIDAITKRDATVARNEIEAEDMMQGFASRGGDA